MPLQDTDSYNQNADGLDYLAASQTWTIARNVLVGSDNDSGVFSNNFDTSTLINYGEVISGTAVGIMFNGTNDVIDNEAGASITGGTTAISLDGANPLVINQGSITALTNVGVLFDAASTAGTLHNTGEIFSAFIGIEVLSLNSGATIINAGTIQSDGEAGVDVDAGDVSAAFITNSGTISGHNFSIEAQEGVVHVANTGLLVGDILLADQADSVFNFGTIQGGVGLGGGRDDFSNSGTVTGQIDGGNGNDFLSGRHLIGDQGADFLDGQSSVDIFQYLAVTDSTVGKHGRDTIFGFLHSQNDMIDLGSIDARSNKNGDQAFDFIGKNAFTHHAGELHYSLTADGSAVISGDVNGDGKGDFEIVALQTVKLDSGDFVL